MNRKFAQPNNRLIEIDTRVNEAKILRAENNTNRFEQLEEESKVTNLRLEAERSSNQKSLIADDQIN